MRVAIAQQVFPYVIQALTEEIPGDELAASVFTLNKLAYTQLHARGEAGLLELLQSVPEYWNQLQPLEPQVRQLIHDFIQWGDQAKSENGMESVETSRRQASESESAECPGRCPANRTFAGDARAVAIPKARHPLFENWAGGAL